jgi:hypothetical protein
VYARPLVYLSESTAWNSMKYGKIFNIFYLIYLILSHNFSETP